MMKKTWMFLFYGMSLFVCVTTLYAQPDLRWGKISQEHLEMTTYAPDTNAAVVILADYGRVYFEDNGEMIFERHTRIKILKEAGYDWGTESISYYAEKGTQSVYNLRGETHFLESNGKVVHQKLDKTSIFKEDIDGSYKRVRFTMPNLKPGAVIEYAYKVSSTNPIFLRGWQFQEEEPTLWSEYIVEVPAGFDYISVFLGSQAFSVRESESASPGKPGKYRWVMENLAALRQEPYMTTPRNFQAAIRFQLSSITHPSFGQHKFLNTWEVLAEELMDNNKFGKLFRPDKKVTEHATGLVAGLEDPLAKMQRVYDDVRNNIQWDKMWGLNADKDPDKVLSSRTGNRIEIAMLLISLLRAADLDAHPVLISTRSHGVVIQAYPLLTQFNDLLAMVRIGSTNYFLDATDPLRPYTLLPEEALNDKGWLVKKEQPTWVSIQSVNEHKHKSFLDVTLNDQGKLLGTYHTEDDGYSALDQRYRLKDAKSQEEFIKEHILEGIQPVAIDSFTITNQDNTNEAIKTKTTFSVEGYAQTAGDFLYVNPYPFLRLEENPFRLPTREFPVDFSYPRNIVHTLRLKIPPGYQLEESLKNVLVRIPNDGGLYRRVVDVVGDMLSVQTQYLIKKSVVGPRYYQELRSFYDRIVAAEAEQVVFKRAGATATGASQNGEGNQ